MELRGAADGGRVRGGSRAVAGAGRRGPARGDRSHGRGHRDRRRNPPVRDPGRPAVRAAAAAVGRSAPAPVGRAGTLRRRARAGRRHRAERAGGVAGSAHRAAGGLARHRRPVRLRRLHDPAHGTRLEHRHRGRAPADRPRRGRRAGPRPDRRGRRDQHGRLVRVHAADRDAAQRRRILIRTGDAGADDPRRSGAECCDGGDRHAGRSVVVRVVWTPA